MALCHGAAAFEMKYVALEVDRDRAKRECPWKAEATYELEEGLAVHSACRLPVTPAALRHRFAALQSMHFMSCPYI